MKKSISVVTLFPGAGQYYAGQIRELFGDLVEVYSYSTSDRSVEKITRADLYLVSTDAFKIAEEESQYVPADGQVVEIYVGYSKDVIRRLKEIPAGTRVLFVNVTHQMAREAITQLEQSGVNQLQFIPYGPDVFTMEPTFWDDVVPENVKLAVTPDEMDFVPAGMEQVINIGHRPCTANTMIETALRLGLESVMEEKKFQNTSVSYPLKNKFKLNIKLYKYFFSGMSEDYAFFLAKKNGSKIEKKGSNLFVNDDGRKIILRLASIDNSTIISGVSFTLSSVALEALKEKYSKEFPDGKWERKKDGKINRQWIEGVSLVIHLNNITETMIESGAIVVLKSIDVKTVINDPLNRLSAQEKQMVLNLTVSSMPTSQVVISVTDRAIEKFLSEQSEMKKHEQQKQQLNF